MRLHCCVLPLLVSCASPPPPRPPEPLRPPPPPLQQAAKPPPAVVVAEPEPVFDVTDAALRDEDTSGVEITLFAKDAGTVTMSKKHTYVVVHRRKELELRAGGQSRPIPVRASTRVRISDDEKHLLVADENWNLRIFSLPSGALEREIPKVRVYDVAGNTLVYRTSQCELYSVSLSALARPKSLGKDCGTVLGLDPEAGRALLGESSELQAMHSRGYANVDLLQLDGGRRDEIVKAANAMSFLSNVSVARDLSRLCYVMDQQVNCTATVQPELVVLRSDPAYSEPLFDPSGTKVAYLTRTKLGAPEHLVVGSAVSGETRDLMVTEHEWWEFLPGSMRLVGHGGLRRFAVVDLRQGWKMELGRPGEEYEGLAMVPGDPTRFFIGRERGNTRDVYLVELGR